MLGYVGIGRACSLGQLCELGGSSFRLPAPQQFLGGLCLGVDVAEYLRQAVMHLAGDPLTLLDDCQLPALGDVARIDNNTGNCRTREQVGARRLDKTPSAAC